MSLLQIENLVAGYGRVPVVHDVSLQVGEGELLAVIGSNGAGKTTVMRTIAGVTKAFSGRISFEGRDLTNASPVRVGQAGIAHVPENRRAFPMLTVEENLRLGGWVRRRDRKGTAEDMARMVERFPILAERRHSLAGTLSGGEQQMLAIGMALMARPRLLMLDEPSLGLAPIVVRRVFEEILQLKAAGTTILLNEQFAVEALEVADRSVVLKLGHVVLTGTAADVRNDSLVQSAYLGA